MNQSRHLNRSIKSLCNLKTVDKNAVLILPFNGDYIDRSINKYQATVTGTPDYVTGYFPGTQAIRISNGNYVQYTIPQNIGDFSFDCFRYDTFPRDIRIGCYVLVLSTNSDYGGVMITSTPTTAYSTSTIKKVLSFNTWYHLALTRESGTVRFFVNGVLAGSKNSSNDAGTVVAVDTGRTFSASENRRMYVSNLKLTTDVRHIVDNGVYTYPVPTKLYWT